MRRPAWRRRITFITPGLGFVLAVPLILCYQTADAPDWSVNETPPPVHLPGTEEPELEEQVALRHLFFQQSNAGLCHGVV